MRTPYYMGFDEAEEGERIPLSYSLTRATDLFIELSTMQACGMSLQDEDGTVLGHWSGYGDTLDIDPPPSTLSFYGPHPDYVAEYREARQWESERRYESAMRFQL